MIKKAAFQRFFFICKHPSDARYHYPPPRSLTKLQHTLRDPEFVFADGGSYEPYKVKVEKLVVAHENSCVSFEGTDSFRVLNYLFFCDESKTVTFAKEIASFAGEITAPASTPFGKWHAYRWHFEKSNQKSDGDINELWGELFNGGTEGIPL